MKKFLISPPFGRYYPFDDAERVLGSYTWKARPGRLKQIISTVRPIPGGWVNAIGLRNPGLDAIAIRPDRIYSLAGGFVAGDWRWMCELLRESPAQRIELNLWCPNVAEHGIERHDVEFFVKSGVVVIGKVPPTEDAWRLADMCAEAGAHYLHFSNALPSPAGGISGDPLRRVNLLLVERAAKRYPIPIIAGGGIKEAAHVRDYDNAGARHFSISSGCLRPVRTCHLIRGAAITLEFAAQKRGEHVPRKPEGA